MNRDDLRNIEHAISSAWSADTSANPNAWTVENPSFGQCAVTACVVQDYLGGELLNTLATLPDGTTDSHYYNMVDGEEIDLTRDQFPVGTRLGEGMAKTGNFDTTRDYVLSYEPTSLRYQILRTKVSEALGRLTS